MVFSPAHKTSPGKCPFAALRTRSQRSVGGEAEVAYLFRFAPLSRSEWKRLHPLDMTGVSKGPYPLALSRRGGNRGCCLLYRSHKLVLSRCGKANFSHALAAPGDVADRCGHPWYYRFWQQAPVLRFMKISAGGLEVGPIEA